MDLKLQVVKMTDPLEGCETDGAKVTLTTTAAVTSSSTSST